MWKSIIPPNGVTKNPDGVTVSLTFTVTDGVQNITETVPKIYDVDSIPQIAQKFADDRNLTDEQKGKVIAIDPSVIVGPVEELLPKIDPVIAERRTFQQLLYDYKAALAGEAIGVAVSLPSGDRLSLITKAYKPEYESMLAILSI